MVCSVVGSASHHIPRPFCVQSPQLHGRHSLPLDLSIFSLSAFTTSQSPLHAGQVHPASGRTDPAGLTLREQLRSSLDPETFEELLKGTLEITIEIETLTAVEHAAIRPLLADAFPLLGVEEERSSVDDCLTAHLYISVNGSAATSHRDRDAVFVLQLFGTKEWTYEQRPGDSYSWGQATLAAGNTLWLPAQALHSTRTFDSVSIHLTLERVEKCSHSHHYVTRPPRKPFHFLEIDMCAPADR